MLNIRLKKTDVVDVFRLWDGCWFLVADRNNYTAIKKKDESISIEPYTGNLSEFLEENEMKAATPLGLRYLGDIWYGKTIKISNTASE